MFDDYDEPHENARRLLADPCPGCGYDRNADQGWCPCVRRAGRGPAPVKFRRVERGWVRVEPSGSTVHVAGPADLSPVFFTYLGGVQRGDSTRCGWCYLGATHSAQAHADQLAAYEAAERVAAEVAR